MELKQELKELVSEIIEIDDFKEDDNFVEDLGGFNDGFRNCSKN